MGDVIEFDASKGAELAERNEATAVQRDSVMTDLRRFIDAAQQARKSQLLIQQGYVGPALEAEMKQAGQLDTCLSYAGQAVLQLMQMDAARD